jgi:molybdopterin/thiamine biosynthesis adenylyltransferase
VSRALVVGIGGLGCPAAIALARAGVDTLGIADDDLVEETNLHRQILFDDGDVGLPKVERAVRALGRRFPHVRVVAHPTRLLPANAVELVSGYDVVVEGSDNFATKFLTADACAIARVAVVHAAAVRWVGTALAVGARGAPCYRCLFEDIPREDAPNCAEAGVMGPVVGVVAALQADLALSLLCGEDVAGTLCAFDGWRDTFRRRKVPPRRDCPLCGSGARIESIETERYVAAECG